MFERFNDGARRAVVFAHDDARELCHDHVGPEHILLGLLHEDHGVAGQVLKSLGITPDGAWQRLEAMLGRGQNAPSGHIPFTARAKSAIELSLRESLQLGHDYIGTEHLLLGIIDDNGSIAAQILIDSNADLNEVRKRVMQELRNPAAATSAKLEPTEMVDDESPEEGSLFADALSIGMAIPEIARIADHSEREAIEDHIRRRRDRMWSLVTDQRQLMRAAAADLKMAEDTVMPRAGAAVWRDRPDLVELYDEAQLQEEQIAGREMHYVALANTFREACGRKLTIDEARRADQLVAEMKDTIQQCGAWLERVRLKRRSASWQTVTAAKDPNQKRTRPRLNIRARARQAASPSTLDSDARYKQILDLLLRIRKQVSEVGTERKRAALQLSQAKRQIARQDKTFQTAEAKLQAASATLLKALLHDALLPEVRRFIAGNR